MYLTKFIVYSLILVKYLVQNTLAGGDELKPIYERLHQRLDNRTSRINTDHPHLPFDKKLRQTSRSSNVSNINDDNDFHFLVTGGYRPENNPLVKFLVSLRLGKAKIFGSNHFCAGSILTKKAILTAAHCLAINKIRLVSRAVTVVVGTPRRLVKTENTQELTVDKIITHLKYIPGTHLVNDIGIMKLKDEIRLNDDFASIIPLNDRDPTGLSCTVIGWGVIIVGGPSPDEAVSGDLVINTRAYCSQQNKLSKGVICASNPNNYEVDSCQGDSGGPLIGDGKLVGIVSYGGECGNPRSIAFYTDVYYFRDWISRNGACCLTLKFPCYYKLPIIMLVFILKRYIQNIHIF